MTAKEDDGRQTIGLGGRTGRYDLSGRELTPLEAYWWDREWERMNRQPAMRGVRFVNGVYVT